MESRYYTIEEIMKLLQVSRATVYNWMDEGLESIKVGTRSRRIPQSALERFIAQRQDEDDPQPERPSPNKRTPLTSAPV